MKKVIALALAVLMLSVVAVAQDAPSTYPGNTISISRDDIDNQGGVKIVVTPGNDVGEAVVGTEISKYVPRSINSTNYSVTNVKFKLGKGLITSISINDTDDCVDIVFADDMTNTKAQSFEASFKLKGKAKYTIDSQDALDSFTSIESSTKAGQASTTFGDDGLVKVTLPSLDFNISGTVGYGMVAVSLGTDTDEELGDLVAIARQLNGTAGFVGYNSVSDDNILRRNIFKFSRNVNTSAGNALPGSSIPMAGSYTADAILTQDYGDALTMDARVYDGDKLYFGLKYTPNKTIVNRLADVDGDLDFYTFGSDKAYTTFNSNVTLYFNDADEDSFVYKVNDNGYLVETGNYSEEDGCWIVKTRTLGTYVVSDVELDDTYVVADGSDPTTTNPDTGANDVVGIATALAAVALVSAAAISLKK